MVSKTAAPRAANGEMLELSITPSQACVWKQARARPRSHDLARRFAIEKLVSAGTLVYVPLLNIVLVLAVTSKLSMTTYLQTGVRWAVLVGLAGAIGVVVGVLGSSLRYS